MLTAVLTGALMSVALVQQTDTIVPIAADGRLEIESFGGDVAVSTWDRDEIRVVAHHSSRTRIAIDRWGSTVRLDADSYRGPASVDYELTVPRTLGVEISGTFVSVHIDGTEGEIRAETTQGDIVVNGGRGYVSLHSTQGNVELDGADGTISVQSVTGSVSVTNSTGEIEAETTSGSVTLENVHSSDVTGRTTSGSVHFSGDVEDGGRYSLATHSGNVIVAVPENFNATVAVSTFSGNLESAFPITLRGTARRGRRIEFTMGTGAARMELESFSGNVELRRWRARR